jgi:hypothetical protein
MTSMGSYDRRSPRQRSPVSPSDASGYESPFPASMSLSAISPRSSISRAVAMQQPHDANRGMLSPRRMVESAKPNTAGNVATKLQGFFMCECCPKKPKKFETREELM